MINLINKKIGVRKDRVVAYTQPTPQRAPAVSLRRLETASGGTTKLSAAASANTSLVEGYLDNMVADDQKQLMQAYRDMYYNDSICGSAVDLWSELPFSDFQMYGVSEDKLEVYEGALARLNLRSSCSQITRQFLVEGSYTSTLVFDPKTTQFIDQIPYAFEDLTFDDSPLLSQDPVITAKVSKRFDKFLNETSPEWTALRKVVPSQLLKALQSGEFVLDPLSTLYLARRTFPTEQPVSYLKRCLPVYMLEKTLYRGTLFELSRRQRANVLVTAGDDTWEPTVEELSALANLFQQSDLDPMGALIVTRSSVNVSEFRCLAGDTLVSSDKGICTIQSLVKHNPETLEPNTTIPLKNVNIKGVDGNFHDVQEWHFRGKAKTVFVESADTKVRVQVTANHRFPIFRNGKFQFERAENLHGQYILLERNGVQAKGSSVLPEFTASRETYNNRFRLPTEMSADLAYLIGMVLAEGYVSDNSVHVMNSDEDILYRVRSIFMRLFHCQATERSGELPSGKTMVTLSVNNRVLSEFFQNLGVKTAKYFNEREEYVGRACRHYEIPDCILSAPTVCKAAFLAAYIDGDGSLIRKNGRIEIKFFTGSERMARQLQMLTFDLGCPSVFYAHTYEEDDTFNGYERRTQYRVYLSNHAAYKLNLLTEKHMAATRKLPNCELACSTKRKDGIPADLVIPLIKGRIVRRKKHGTVFLDDEGDELYVEGGWVETCIQQIYHGTPFLYDQYEAGYYDDFMRFLASVMPSLHRAMLRLFKLKPLFELANVSDAGETYVYDLTMNEAESLPIFSANGILTKNSAGDFVKWTDVYDQTTSMKLKALGISDAFLSSDSSFNNAEQAVQVFMDNLSAYRSYFTHSLFTNKLFPLIAMTKRFYKDEGKNETANGLNIKTVNDYSRLDIPKVRWNKRLSASNDENLMASLTALTEHGVPIPMRLMIAASGVDPDTLLSELEDDANFRGKVEAFTKTEAEEEDYELSSLSSLSKKGNGFKNLVKSGLLSDAVRISNDGSVHHVINQSKAHKDVNEKIVKAVIKNSKEGK